MASKKTETAVNVTYVGGPVDGLTMRVNTPPMPRVRMVEGRDNWGTYEYDGMLAYVYVGEEWERQNATI